MFEKPRPECRLEMTQCVERIERALTTAVTDIRADVQGIKSSVDAINTTVHVHDKILVTGNGVPSLTETVRRIDATMTSHMELHGKISARTWAAALKIGGACLLVAVNIWLVARVEMSQDDASRLSDPLRQAIAEAVAEAVAEVAGNQ